MEKVKDNPIEWNKICYELTYRIFVPFKGITFEELLLKNGYIIIQDKKEKDFTKKK